MRTITLAMHLIVALTKDGSLVANLTLVKKDGSSTEVQGETVQELLDFLMEKLPETHEVRYNVWGETTQYRFFKLKENKWYIEKSFVISPEEWLKNPQAA